MKVIDAITPLLVESRLFEDPERVKHSAAHNHRKRKTNMTHMGLKIGQGGTLDPLADGVLGESCHVSRSIGSAEC
jgi:tRNA pseudouridine55 synthase